MTPWKAELERLQKVDWENEARAKEVISFAMEELKRLDAELQKRDKIIERATDQINNSAHLDKCHPHLLVGDSEYLVGVITSHAKKAELVLTDITAMQNQQPENEG